MAGLFAGIMGDNALIPQVGISRDMSLLARHLDILDTLITAVVFSGIL